MFVNADIINNFLKKKKKKSYAVLDIMYVCANMDEWIVASVRER